ncbi:hypothetical protein FRACA_1520010 [Frankia canadensis]|uniref:Uncharacterized protein n=1 Tax=Frankia canadensis TaxID=1836972 RepID=A0A2I2KM38_9ACTN|nr:hypothetical protein FRACA_1520010 [Frankia canadensis]SOU54021.1 hypothetical protein FRACA_1520010 [Frankia canadensis]
MTVVSGDERQTRGIAAAAAGERPSGTAFLGCFIPPVKVTLKAGFAGRAHRPDGVGGLWQWVVASAARGCRRDRKRGGYKCAGGSS